MFYKRLFLSIFITLGIMLFCAGCQDAPEDSAVINKSKQNFDVKVVASEDETQALLDNTLNVSCQRTFTSTDGSVNFLMDIDQTINSSAMSVVKVKPHFLTGEDAKRVATSLFPNADFFEAEPERAKIYSRSEIQGKLGRWSQYTNIDALENLYGDSQSEDYVDIIRSFIEEYALMYEQSPAENPHTPCEWKMRNSSVYTLTADELAEASISDYSDEMSTQFSVNGIPYCLTATTRNKDDYKVNMISCYIYDGLCPRDLDERIFAAKLCRTDEPSQEQLDSIKLETEKLLSSFNLGHWQIDECYVQSKNYGNETEYYVRINAVPVLNGISALRHPQIGSLRNQNGYAANYYLSDVQFVFSANGELISFSLFSPLDIQEIVDDNVKVPSIDNLLNQAQKHLELSDSYNYGFGPFLEFIEEEVQCNITVSEIEYGLSRIKVPNNEDAYYYVPSIRLKGCSEYIGKESSEAYYVSEKPEILLVINALDGTVINATNE